MSTVIATSVLPDSTANDTLTFGATGDSVAISGDSLNLNTLQDAGGNTTFVSDGSGTITSQGLPGAMILISSQTVTNQASVSFTTGLDSTYDVYVFKFYNIHAVTSDSGVNFFFQTSTDGGSSYGVIATTTYFGADFNENGTGATLQYIASGDLAQSTGYQRLTQALGNIADEATSGTIHLFAPSSTTYVKHFYTRFQGYGFGNTADDMYAAGYFNTTTALNAIDFKMGSGTFSGTIAMYGISKS